MSKDFNIEAKNDFIITQAIEEGADQPFDVVDTNKKQQYLEVIAVGEQVESCKVGDKVIPYGAEFQAFTYRDKQYVVLTDQQVLGVVNV
jgi:co-chaperonin GroES (HSP10)